jgi:hypothetical protein
MNTAASVIATAVTAPGFKEAMKASYDGRFDYSFFMNPLWARAIHLGLVIIVFVAVMFLSRRMMKKYPMPRIVIRAPKIDVFGSKYESVPDPSDKNEAPPDNGGDPPPGTYTL